MKNLSIIFLLTCSCIAAQGQAPSLSYLSASAQTQVKKYTKFVVDSAVNVVRKELAAANVRFDTSFINLRTFSAFEFKGIKGRLKYLEDSTVVVQFDSTVMIRNMLITAKTPAFELLQQLQSLYNDAEKNRLLLDDKIKAAAKKILE